MNKFAFFHLPRTGGSFLGYYIREYLNNDCIGIGHQRYIDVEEQIKDSFPVIFVRNPFEWYISRYFYYVRPDYKTEGGILKGVDGNISGDEFVNRFPTFESRFLWGIENCHNFTMQYCFDQMAKKDGKLMVAVGQIEKVQEEFDQIYLYCGIKKPKVSIAEYYNKHKESEKHTNRSYHEHYSEYHTPKTIELIKKFDAEIIDMFGYEFNKG